MTDRELMQQALEALEQIAAYRPLTFAECSDAEAVMGIAERAIPALRERLAQPEQEIDWKDQYEKQKRRAEMWRDKYEAVAGPDECVYPAQPEQEPVAWMFEDDEDNGHKTFRQTPPSPEAVAYLAKWNRPAWAPLYTAPQRREWVGLTRDEVLDIEETHPLAFYRAIEAKLREKNA